MSAPADMRFVRPPRRGEGGFSLIEVMIALLILLIGVAGVLTLQTTAMRATSVSRHATEASVVAEDKLEDLRTEPVAALLNGSDYVDARGIDNANGPYTRTWTVTSTGSGTVRLVLRVTWLERGADEYTISLVTERRP